MVSFFVGQNERYSKRYYSTGIVLRGFCGIGGAMCSISYSLFGTFSRGRSVDVRPEDKHRKSYEMLADPQVYV